MKKTLSVLALCTAVLFVMSMAGSLLADDSAKININTASIDELAQLKRIGLKYAERIVEYREKNGPFQRPEEIMLVKGIGTKTWELNKEQIIVEVVKDKKG